MCFSVMSIFNQFSPLLYSFRHVFSESVNVPLKNLLIFPNKTIIEDIHKETIRSCESGQDLKRHLVQVNAHCKGLKLTCTMLE